MNNELLALFLLEVMQVPVMVLISMIVAFVVFITALRLVVKQFGSFS